MRRADGYTLAETLVGLAILGLAFSGLFETTRVVGRFQHEATHATSDVAARRSAARVLQLGLGDGPALTGALQGDTTQFASTCLDGAACGARIEDGVRLVAFHGGHEVGQALLPSDTAEFRYVDGSGDRTSRTGATPATGDLRAILIVSGHPATVPIATLVLRTDESPGCVFDDVGQTCRVSP